jgi:hypothetical protein
MGAALMDATDLKSGEGTPFDQRTADDDKAEDLDGLDPELETPSGQFALIVGGKEPTSHSLRMSGGKINTKKAYEKGTVLKVTYEVRVDEVHFIDKKDPKTDQVVASERKHVLKAISEPSVKQL